MAIYEVARQVASSAWLCLHRNENLFVAHDWVAGCLSAHLQEGTLCTAYPDPQCSQLREALADLYAVQPANVYVGNGSDGVLADLFTMLRRRYAAVSILDIGFRVYCLLADRLHYRVEVIAGNTFHTHQVCPDVAARLYVVDSPNSVTGVRLPPDSLFALAQDEDSFLIWDNVHGDFSDDLQLAVHDNIAFVRSFSKYYGLAGLRIGYCIAHADLVTELMTIKDVYNVNAVAQFLAYEALQRRAYFDSVAKLVVQARELLVTALTTLGFRVHEPWGNFVFATHAVHTAERIQYELGEKRIAVRRFSEEPIANYLRITVPPLNVLPYFISTLREIIERIEA